MTRTLSALLAAALAACAEAPTEPARPEPRDEEIITHTAPCEQPAPVVGSTRDRVPDQYIVVFREGTDVRPTVSRLAQKYGFTPAFVYEHALQGFSATLNRDQLGGVRCEPETQTVGYVHVVRIAG